MLTQIITPEILDWIATQARAGHPQQAVLDAMRASGWKESVATAAVARARAGRLPDDAPGVAVPEPDAKDTKCVFETSDRQVPVLMSVRLPRIMVFGSLLSTDECDELMELAQPALKRSTTVDNWNGGSEVTDYRNSDGTYFGRGAHPLLVKLESRIAQLLGWPVEKGEGIQVLRYGPGGEYRPHHDYFDPTIPGSAAMLPRGGQRVATLIMYLRSPEQGGATIFPETRFQVAPVKGNAVFFSYDRAHQKTLTLHGGAPVLAGEKWIATKWLREEIFT